jgi:hypothetical protein
MMTSLPILVNLTSRGMRLAGLWHPCVFGENLELFLKLGIIQSWSASAIFISRKLCCYINFTYPLVHAPHCSDAVSIGTLVRSMCRDGKTRKIDRLNFEPTISGGARARTCAQERGVTWRTS